MGGRGASSGNTINGLKNREDTIRKQMIKLYNENSGFYRIDIKSVQQARDKWYSLQREADTLRDKRNKLEKKNENKQTTSKRKTFVNSYGEATNREITSATYKRQQSRVQKQILRNMGY